MKPSLEMMLRAENQELRDSQAVMAGFLVGLLREHHSGRAFVSLTTLAEIQSKPYQIKGFAQPELGNLALVVVGPDGKEQVMDDARPAEVFHEEYYKYAASIDPSATLNLQHLPEYGPGQEALADRVAALVEVPPHPVDPCNDPWHSSSDRVGFLCPHCGSSEVSPMREDAGIDVDINKES